MYQFSIRKYTKKIYIKQIYNEKFFFEKKNIKIAC